MASSANLPDVEAPLIRADGSVITPLGRMPKASAQSFTRIELPTATNAQRLVANTTRKLIDIPAPVGQVSTLSTILVYTASGLSDAEIAIALKLPITQLRGIKEAAVYKQLESYIIEAVKSQVDEEVRDILARGSVNAAKSIITLMDHEDGKVALAASKDVLDRTGHKVAERIDINMQMRNTFRIEVVDKRDVANSIPSLDIDGEIVE